MPFVDLEDEYPSSKGIYNVKINSIKSKRDSSAKWTDKGFVLISDELLSDEYIYAWFKEEL